MHPNQSWSTLNRILLSVEKPGRYTGGEYGIVHKDTAGLLRCVISYPDLYEIGMSNLAISFGNYWQGMVAERIDYAAVLYLDALLGMLVILLIPFLQSREESQKRIATARTAADTPDS